MRSRKKSYFLQFQSCSREWVQGLESEGTVVFSTFGVVFFSNLESELESESNRFKGRSRDMESKGAVVFSISESKVFRNRIRSRTRIFSSLGVEDE